jgi:hypothetical protein
MVNTCDGAMDAGRREQLIDCFGRYDVRVWGLIVALIDDWSDGEWDDGSGFLD